MFLTPPLRGSAALDKFIDGPANQVGHSFFCLARQGSQVFDLDFR
jgi:hypothetical protein